MPKDIPNPCPSCGSVVPVIMTNIDLRSWFAGMALQGILATWHDHALPSEPNHPPMQALRMRAESAEKLTYAYADAMIAQREVP